MKKSALHEAREAYDRSSQQLSLAQKSSALTMAMSGGFYFLSTQIDTHKHPVAYGLLIVGTAAGAAAAFVSLPALANAIWDNYQKHRTFRTIERDISILERQLQNPKKDNIPSCEL